MLRFLTGSGTRNWCLTGQSFAAAARDCGVTKLCIEMHGDQLVYNVPTLLKLRKEIGQVVGANFDPSHLF
jgi:hypothetical protein